MHLSRLFHLRLFLIAAVSKLRFRLRLSLASCPQYAISDGRLARPHIPASRLFVLFHSSKAPSHQKKWNIPYWYCPLCTPSLTLPPSSLKCLQKSNPNIHRKCFRCFGCFRCFRCFISLLDQKTARFWSKSEQTRQTDRVVPPLYHGYGKPPKRQSTHLWGRIPTCLRRHTRSCLASYSRSCFFAEVALFSLHAQKRASIGVFK